VSSAILAPMAAIIKYDSATRFDRGNGVYTIPLATDVSTDGVNKIVTGTSSFPVGQGAPLHLHNCDEQVTLLSGRGEVEVDDIVTALEPYDSTYIEAGKPHCFRNTSETEPMLILWIYTAQQVTRTFVDTGIEVEHLSSADLVTSAQS
jgi:mannose-6-phosphate isomerase-like protein (cupin superfamily)